MNAKFFTTAAGRAAAAIAAVCLVTVLSTFTASAQTTMGIGSMSASVGDTLTIPVTVANFTDIGAISLKINYNSSAVKYIGITGAPAGVNFIASASATVISIGWFDATGSTPLNFGSGVLMKLRVVYNGGSGPFTFDTPQCDIASSLGTSFSVGYANGTLTQSTNAKPTFASIAAIAKNETETVTFTVSATDPNSGDVLTYSAGTLPAGATFTAATRTFSWVPALNTAGVYTVKFYVTDGSLMDSTTAVITISKMNVKPSFTAIAAIAKNEQQTVTFTVSATDPNTGDVLTYSAGTLPAGATFTASIRTFSWVPALNTAGVYTVKFYVTDGSLMDSTTAVITISKTNLAPVFVSRIPATLDTIQANLGYAVNYKVVASDPNNDALTYTWKVNGAVMKSGKDSTFVPATFTQLGSQKIVCVFTDGTLADSTTWSFTVAAKATAVGLAANGVPTDFAVQQNYPNPFNPSTTISFSLPNASPVTLVVYDMLGGRVRTLIGGSTMTAASHQIVWDGKNEEGAQVASGMYLYRLSTDTHVSTMKMLLMK